MSNSLSEDIKRVATDIDGLIALLQATPTDHKGLVIEAIGKLKDPKAVPVLIKILQEKPSIYQIRLVCKVLVTIGDDHAVAPMVLLLRENDDKITSSAEAITESIIQLGHPEMLRDALRSEDPTIRFWTIKKLQEQSQSAMLDERAAESPQEIRQEVHNLKMYTLAFIVLVLIGGAGLLLSLSVGADADDDQMLVTGAQFIFGISGLILLGAIGSMYQILRAHFGFSPVLKYFTCPSCEHKSRVNLREYIWNCYLCGKNQQKNIPHNAVPTLNNGIKCSECSYEHKLSGKPAVYECPQCKAQVNIGKIPINIY